MPDDPRFTEDDPRFTLDDSEPTTGPEIAAKARASLAAAKISQPDSNLANPGLSMGDIISNTGTGLAQESQGIGDVAAGAYGMVRHPIDTAVNEGKRIYSEGKQAAQSAGQGKYADAAGHALAMNPLEPMIEGPINASKGGSLRGLGQVAGMAIAPDLTKGAIDLAPEVPGAIGKAASTARNILIGPDINKIPATDAFIKSTKPRNSIKNIVSTVETGLPDARRAADSMNLDLDNMTLQDAEKAVVKAKGDVWGEFENNHLGPNKKIPVNTNVVAAKIQGVADGMTDIQKRRLGVTDENGVDDPNHSINKAVGDYQGQTMSLGDINSRIQELNNQLRSQQAQYKVNEMALRRDPKFAPLYAELDGLRQVESDTLDNVSGPGSKDLKKRYGALKVMEDVISRRIPVAERAAPVPVFQGLGRMAGIGNVAGGTWQTLVGGKPEVGLPNVVKGLTQIQAGKNAQLLNDPHALIQQAFKAAKPRSAMPAPPIYATPARPSAASVPTQPFTVNAPPNLSPMPQLPSGQNLLTP